jgi:superfamily II DNA or RNA helicase
LAQRRKKRSRSGQKPPVSDPLKPQSLRPTHFTRSLAQAVEGDVRQRGDIYFQQGRVHAPQATPDRISSQVHGKGGQYSVTIDMAVDDKKRRAAISALCTCPFFAEGRGCCKHIWAVLVYADHNNETPFKVPPGYHVGFLKRNTPTPRKLPAVVSVTPGESSRIRAFSARDLAGSGVPHREQESRPAEHRSPRNDQPNWRDVLKLVSHTQRDLWESRQRISPQAAQDLHYILDVEQTKRSGQLTIQLFRLLSQNGSDETVHPLLIPAAIDPHILDSLSEGTDREVLMNFFGVASTTVARAGTWEEGASSLRTRGHSFVVADCLRSDLLHKLALTGRFGWLAFDELKSEKEKTDQSLGLDAQIFKKIVWEDEFLWSFRLNVLPRKQDGMWMIRGEILRDDRIGEHESAEVIPLAQALAAFPDGLVILKNQIIQLELADNRMGGWITSLRQVGAVRVDKSSQATFLRSFADQMGAPPIDLPPESGWSLLKGIPRPKLIFSSAPFHEKAMVLMANHEFDYEIPPGPPILEDPRIQDKPQLKPKDSIEGATTEDIPNVSPTNYELPNTRVILKRDPEQEESLIKELHTHSGVHPSAGRAVSGADVFIDTSSLSELVADLNTRGWSVEAEGKKVRTGRSFNVDVKSNMDWFDLKARFDFGDGHDIDLPKILEAMRRGEDRIQLDDGTVGLLPDSWLKQLEPILKMGQSLQDSDALRYQSTHAAFLDVLVEAAETASIDESFAAYRAKLAAFNGIQTSRCADSFKGELRPYQNQGLGWLEFLDEFAFGGCLADDMGLGKTVQVLAHLQKRRHQQKAQNESVLPNLVVAPTSLIHNWVDEAQRFVPDLKIVPHMGASRSREATELSRFDVIVTSYGTMRSDIELLGQMSFDYVILDEAQAIKNETTQAAKASRVLKARRRLAMSGTPVENRLSELGSLFRFLNPGMFESTATFSDLFSGPAKLTPGRLSTLAKALRPFILRRTKEQVLPELPGKTETTIYCVLDEEARREYDKLAAHYRSSLKSQVKTEGMQKTRMQVLEALLRLRQLACHPGLIDQGRISDPSAKLDLLEEQLEEVINSGRKALVFSQFTSMLSIVRSRLDARGIVYEYLDGSTTHRKDHVENFQNNDQVKLFLISLKAGGVGLNLTAADYCFILDPWWNPASEAQAIDRAHRIGQKNHVFAYRLITRGTVEEKILELQAAKRKLVDGIIAADGDVLSEMTAEDLDFLLG